MKLTRGALLREKAPAMMRDEKAPELSVAEPVHGKLQKIDERQGF